jgi:hypothetical protein
VKTTAPLHGTPHLASLGKIIRIVGDHYVWIKRMSALPAITVGIVQAGFFFFAHAAIPDIFCPMMPQAPKSETIHLCRAYSALTPRVLESTVSELRSNPRRLE